MGSYCSGKQQDICTKNKGKRLSKNLSPVQQESLEKKNFELETIEIIEMLNTHHRNTTVRSDFPYIESMEILGELGKGGQAQIFEIMIQTSQTADSSQGELFGSRKQLLALKKIYLPNQKKNRRSINLANKLMIQNSCPFLMTGLFCCQNNQFLYEGMNVAKGGDLDSFLEKTTGKGDAFRRLGQDGIRLTIAGIVLGLESLHEKGLIHCDLKTDNILIGGDGYPILSDFQLTKEEQSLTVQDFEGTLTYVGPQIMQNVFFDKGVDLWALGILIFNLSYNELPYSKEEVLHRDFVNQCKRRENKYKMNRKKLSVPLQNLINSLLKVKPQCRLGYKGMDEIKNHQFFAGFSWSEYSEKQLINPLQSIVERYPIKRHF